MRTHLGEGGRVVVPAEFRRAMGLSPGDPILLVLEGDQVRMLTPRAAIRRAQQLVGPYVAGGPSMADELLAERREEARLEGGRASSTAR